MENVGLYVASKPLSLETSYFEIQILNPGSITAIGIGLVPSTYPMNAMPGWRELSVGYHADDGWSVFFCIMLLLFTLRTVIRNRKYTVVITCILVW